MLTELAVKKAKPTEKLYRLADAQGLCLEVTPGGVKLWRWRYRWQGKASMLSLGAWPEVGLKAAREKLADVRKAYNGGTNPAKQRHVAKLASKAEVDNTFEVVAREFHDAKRSEWSGPHATRWLERLRKDVFPWLGRMLLPDITAPMLLQTLRRVESRGVRETVHSIQQACGQVFRYGIATGRCERNPAADLRGALKPVLVKHMAAVTEPKAVGELLRAINEYQGHPYTRGALTLSALLFQRPGNVRTMQWSALDLDGEAPVWTIPAAEMKRSRYEKQNGRHALRAARRAGGGDPEGPSPPVGAWHIRFPQHADGRTADEREHGEHGSEAPWVRPGNRNCTRLPRNGEDDDG